MSLRTILHKNPPLGHGLRLALQQSRDHWNQIKTFRVKFLARSAAPEGIRMRRNIEVVEDDAGKATTYRRHPNGGGLIGPGARVEEDSFVGPSTYVEAGARIGSGCRIGRGGWIDRHALVGDHVVIGDDVYVGRGSVVDSRVRIGSHSRIGAGARIEHGSRLHGDSIVPENSHVANGRPSRTASPRSRQASGPGSRMAA